MTETPRPLQIFVDCFNICYPDWEIRGDATKDLKPKHVDYDENLRTSWGRCGPRRNGKVYYRIQRKWWNNHDPGEQLGLVLHELGHVKHCPGHPPAFWDLVVDNYFDVAERPGEIEEIFGEPIKWENVVEFIVNDPHNGLVDNRKEIVYERRRKLAEALNYPVEDLEPFSQMRILTRRRRGPQYTSVDIEDLEFDSKSVDELVDYFHTRPRPRLGKENDSYVVEPPLAKENGDGTYYVVENDEVAALATRVAKNSDRDTLTVEVEK